MRWKTLDKKTQKALNARIERMSPEERRVLYKRARTLRRGGSGLEVESPSSGDTRHGSRNWRDWLGETDEPNYVPTRSRNRPLRDVATEILLGDSAAPAGMERDAEAIQRGIVTAILRDSCTVWDGDIEVACGYGPVPMAGGDGAVAVGDEVAFAARAGARGRLVSVHPRRTVLARPDTITGQKMKVLAANIDLVLIVASAQSPPIRPRLIDRILIASQVGGFKAALCVNKVDLIRSAEERAEIDRALGPYREIGLRVIDASAATGEGIDEIRRLAEGKTCVLAGHSGVGKSSILNALDPSLDLQTGEVSRATDRGRHTTSASRLIRLPGGIRIIDTPGVRQFGLWKISPGDLASYFPDLEAHAAACRFADCRHLSEPDCAVREAAGGNPSLRARYSTYRRIVATI